MTDSKLAVTNVIESALVDGDLSKLTPEQRVSYYKAVCTSLDLNPLTRPFNYINLNGKLTLYATKTAADQLRNNHNVSVDDVTISEDADSYTVIVKGHDATGRSDVEIGVVSKKDMQGNQGNAKMKAVTKAKRRLTLSLCGLGMLDETELETIPQAKIVSVSVETGEVVDEHIQSAKDAISKVQALADETKARAMAKPSNGDMTLEEAKAIMSTENVPYGDIPTEKLSRMANSINKKLQDGGYSSENQDIYIRKLNAIKLILADRPA